MSGINLEHTIYLKVLTPLHVGGAQEKHLRRDVDYIEKNGTAWMLNWPEVYKIFEPDEIAQALVKRRLRSLLDNELEDLAEPVAIYGDTGEIKAFIRDGGGRPYLPGSSIKGALKSWLLTAFSRDLQINTLGSFDTDLFRFVKPSDCYFSGRPTYFPTKVFNLWKDHTNAWKGGWKHAFRGSNHQPATNGYFSEHGFVTDYESFPPGTNGIFWLKLTEKWADNFLNRLFEMPIRELQHKLNQSSLQLNQRRKIENQLAVLMDGRASYRKLYQNNPLFALFQNVNNETKKHIDREIKFFENYSSDKVDAVLSTFKSLSQTSKNVSPGQCVLRLSAGSGFHGISGDHQFNDHVDTGIWTESDVRKYKLSNRQAQDYVGKYKRFKSRKMAFEEGRFYPMGFVLLSTLPLENDGKLMEQKSKSFQTIAQPENPVETVIMPQVTEASLMTTETAIYAEIMELGKPFHLVKLLLTGYPFEPLAQLSIMKGYSFKVGQIVKCRVNQRTKEGRITLVKFQP